MELDKHYDAEKIEKKWQEFWEKKKTYKFDSKSKKPVYSIDTPPPYASAGHLHIGHALHYTQFEIIARFRRMAGYNVFFPPGFDDNGLPTEKYVEEKFKISKKDTTRAEFRKLCMEETAKVEKAYADRVFKALGHSYDWDLLYTTISPEAQKVAQMSFIDLYKKKEVYRSEEPTLWCTKHQTALAQAEVEDVSRTTSLNDIEFDLENGEKIVVATTRPEFLSACVGIFVHPDDKRYKELVGKKAIVPVYGQKVKIRADEKVDPEFGTGIVMICTFGDTTDIEWWKKHNLDLKIIVNYDGTLNKETGILEGLTISEAKEKILEELQKEGRLKQQEPLQQTVGGCWRCKTPIEFLVTKQWFIHTLKYKKELIEQGRKVNWYPEFYRVRYEDWVNNLGWDWCISRQRFFGVPIPVWYCKKCGKEVVADENDIPVDPTESKPKKKCECGCEDLEPEDDVFDTWMTSSVSPQVAGRWIDNPKQFRKVFPFSLRPQSHDIIRTWAFYTILKSFLHEKSIPWKDLAIGTYILDEKGRGMHKSAGNTIWFDDLYKQYKSIDIIRYWIGNATWGVDMPFQEKDLIAGKRFLTKLWNASKFAFMHLQDYDGKKPSKLEIIDEYTLIKLNDAIKEATKNFEEYNSSVSKKAVEQFFWKTFCDNYLEIAKDRLYNPDKRGDKARKSAQYTLYQSLLAILKMISPIMPHITEELYQYYFKAHEKEESIHTSEWPKELKLDNNINPAGELAIYAVEKVRQAKTEKNLSLKLPAKRILIKGKISDKEFESIKAELAGVTKTETIEYEKLDSKSEIDMECIVEI